MTEGLLTERAAFTIVNELSVLDDIHAAEAAILGWVRNHQLVGIKKACQREIAQRSPAAADKANQRADDERSVRMHTNDLGRADLVHDHDAVDAGAVMTSLSRAAVYLRRRGDTRTMDQLRNDIALTRLLPRTKRPNHAPADTEHTQSAARHDSTSTSTPGPGTDREPSPDHDLSPDHDVPDKAGAGADASVVIHATGAEVRALIDGEESTGGEADHHGPIPQSSLRKHLLRALAQALLPNLPTTPNSSRTARAAATCGGGSRIEVQITDQPPPSDPGRYTPSAALDSYVRLRDRVCRFPGCNRPAEFTDLDHRIAFAAGGRTTAANLWCLCRHHHRLKHEGGWHIRSSPDGTSTWTSPTGRRYPNNPTDP